MYIVETNNFSKKYCVVLRPENLMSIKLNYVYGSFQIFFVIGDQVKNILLEANFEHFGPEKTFFYWFLVFCVEDFRKILYSF